MSVHMRTLVGLFLLTMLLVPGPHGSTQAQIPDKFENLKILPKDISKRELVAIMRGMSGALGVRCKYCHVGESENSLEGYDFASDDKESKKIARVMLKMVSTINDELVPAAKIDNPPRVRCVTCHRGLENPETLDQVLTKTAEKEGTPAAIDQYRKLREEYYGSGSYDFGTGTLATVTENLSRSDVDGAIAVAELNIEFNPEDAYAHLLLGQLHMTKGNKDAAIASIKRSLEIDPENRWAKQMLEKATASE